MAREHGTVKWFSNERGYGFIERSTGEDVFVHHSDIEGDGYKTLRAGETVEFEVVEAEKGPKAEGVVRENGAAASATAGAGEEDTAASSIGPGSRESEAPESAEPASRDRTLADQLREKLGRRFFGG